MCIRPTTVHLPYNNGYRPQQVPCGYCWACLKNQTNDLVGRCLLEAQYSDYSRVLTLTYDDRRLVTPDRARLIFKEDFQKFMYRMRAKRVGRTGPNQYKIRYVGAGEYGSRKGRTHFHVVLFGKGQPPDIALNKKYQYLHEWPHGFTYAENAGTERSIRYVVKYLVKQKAEQAAKKRDTAAQEWFTYSKRPCLGAAGIYDLALKQAEMGIMPYNLRYTPQGAKTNANYSLRGKAEEIYFDTLFAKLPNAETLPCNEWVANARDRYLKNIHRKEWEKIGDFYGAHVQLYYETQGITKDRFVSRDLTGGLLTETLHEAAIYRAVAATKGLEKWLVKNGEEVAAIGHAAHWAP